MNTRAYYNEFDPKAAAWLRALIEAGVIASGDVDERSILDVRPEDLAGYTQCHFFAGIGTWSAALRGAGWPDDRPVWSGSCPCQPFAASGAQKGFEDERHLWPVFASLIRACAPPVVFMEQVSTPKGLVWLDQVVTDYTAMGYTVAPIDLPASAVGAPHMRQRLWIVADRFGEVYDLTECAASSGCNEHRAQVPAHKNEPTLHPYVEDSPDTGRPRSPCVSSVQTTPASCANRLALPDAYRREQQQTARVHERRPGTHGGSTPQNNTVRARRDVTDGCSNDGGVGVTECARLERHGRHVDGGDQSGRLEANETGPVTATSAVGDGANPAQTHSFWRDADWLFCQDGRWRPVEPGTFPLVNGATGRVGLLRGYGNGIVKPLAEEVIRAYLTVRHLPGAPTSNLMQHDP